MMKIMKNTKMKYVIAYLAALCLLAGCTEGEVADVSYGGDIPAGDEASVTSSSPEDDGDDAEDNTDSTEDSDGSKADAAPEEPGDLVIRYMETVEVYDEIALSDFVTEANVELSDGTALIDTSDIGEHEVEIPYIYEGHEFTQAVRYTVEDNTPPVLLAGVWNLSILRGNGFDLEGYVSYADNYDRKPSLSWGEFDTETLGTYVTTAVIEDESGNTYSWDITVNVVDELPPYDGGGAAQSVDFSDFIAKYESYGEDIRFGIDVSEWQGDIDFDAVRDAGCSFVMIRVGYYYSEITMDKYFLQNIEKATEAGLDVGIYYYSTDRDAEIVREHAKWIAEQLEGYELDLPVAFDWENFGRFQQYEMSIHDLNEVYEVFAEEIESCGYSAMIYGSKNYLNTFWDEKTKTARPVWLAHYTSQTDYEGDYMIWQASCTGRIPGIYGDVDMDILIRDQR